MSKLEKILLPSVALLAVAGLALALLDRVQQPSQAPLRAQLVRLRAELGSLRTQADSLRSSVAGLQAATAHAATSQNLSTLQAGLAQIALCMPQVEQQINGLNVQLDTQNGYVTDAFLSNPTIISSNCERTLNGG